MDLDDELVQAFARSCQEQLARIEDHLLALEHDASLSCLDAIFRSVHTIKADAAAMGLESMSGLAHLIEDVLQLTRSGRLAVSRRLIDVLLQSFDALRAMALSPLEPRVQDCSGSCFVLGTLLAEALNAGESSAGPLSAAGSQSFSAIADKGLEQTQLSIPVLRVDQLMDQVGEVAALHARLEEQVRSQPHLTALAEEMAAQIGRVREQVMALRMVSLKPLFAKCRRLVRDVASQTGKEVVFHASGENTELDKSVLERLHGPLSHLLRNAVDHGVEIPAVRRAAGKAGAGTVRLQARQLGGEVELLIEDDGQGVDRNGLWRRAAEPAGLDQSDACLLDLVSLPGVSTAGQVSSYSGRGVGMDAVRREIAALRGTLEIASALGVGTTVRIRLPLSLAMLDALQLAAGSESFFVHLEHIDECLGVRRQDIALRQGVGSVAVRGVLLPLICMRAFLDLPAAPPVNATILVVRAAENRFALLVDRVIGQRQIVLKTFHRTLGPLDGILGGALTGAGRLALVLDIPGMARGLFRSRGPAAEGQNNVAAGLQAGRSNGQDHD